ncbi:MAG: L,D-transpeptidase family protein [Sporomusaceae bacterium]|nr:L,D-transpeptidase family protein [Sporomusaceae bacterium]
MKPLLIRSSLFFSIMGVLLLGLVIAGVGLDLWNEMELAAIPDQPATAPKGKLSIVIKVPARLLELHEDGKVYKKYRIAVGKGETPSPVGEWIVEWKSYRAGDIFGTRYLSLNVPWGGYGIHGTNQPWSIGHYASHGCIRMRNKDVEELFEWVPVGTPVRIEGQVSSIRHTLKLHSMGQDVVQVQLRLKTLGYLEGRADGFFNGDTDVAVKRFQHDKGLKPNGVVDRKTLNLLGL